LTNQRYDKTSIDSIYEFAKKLTGKSLAESIFIPREIVNSENKGDLGSLLESFYFEHNPQSNKGPDFAEAGLELKTTGVVPSKKGGYRAKERLVLTMINFDEIVNETWETSNLLAKCNLMLIMFYLYEKDRPVVDRRFVLDPLLFRLLEVDFQTIRQDWVTIQQKVREGKAHELSEGDTIFLGACRKGAGGENESLRSQPFSKELAKARAFSLKPSYINFLLSRQVKNTTPMHVHESQNFEQVILSQMEKFQGLPVREIAEMLGLAPKTTNNKAYNRQLVVRMLLNGGYQLAELERASIEMKTIRLARNRRPREHMSFPGFDFFEILNEEWEDSQFFERLERKFLFIVFRENDFGDELFERAMFWNMPYSDRLEAQRVWQETKKRVPVDVTNLPRSSESHVAHVRPKGRDGNDKIPTPQGILYLKQAFWLNRDYIAGILAR
jgi:DNA mismatch repair protein MutH